LSTKAFNRIRPFDKVAVPISASNEGCHIPPDRGLSTGPRRAPESAL